MTSFAEIVTLARQLAGTSGMTEAEFDFSLTNDERGTNSALVALASAAYLLANEGAEVDETTEVAELDHRQDNSRALIQATATEREAFIAAAKAKSYTGWSDAARGQGKRIEYATG